MLLFMSEARSQERDVSCEAMSEDWISQLRVTCVLLTGGGSVSLPEAGASFSSSTVSPSSEDLTAAAVTGKTSFLHFIAQAYPAFLLGLSRPLCPFHDSCLGSVSKYGTDGNQNAQHLLWMSVNQAAFDRV